MSHTCCIPELLFSLLPNYPAGDSYHPSFIPSCAETQWEGSKSVWLVANVTQFDMKGPGYSSLPDGLDSCFIPL
jgi:hypothetical protein